MPNKSRRPASAAVPPPSYLDGLSVPERIALRIIRSAVTDRTGRPFLTDRMALTFALRLAAAVAETGRTQEFLTPPAPVFDDYGPD